jgi:DNA-binding NarL/FixJ family response regulator
MCTGITTKEIAHQLGISMRTVECHRQRLLDKSGCRTACALGVWAVRKKLLLECHPSRELCEMQPGAGV